MKASLAQFSQIIVELPGGLLPPRSTFLPDVCFPFALGRPPVLILLQTYIMA